MSSTVHHFVKQGLYYDDWGIGAEVVFGQEVGKG